MTVAFLRRVQIFVLTYLLTYLPVKCAKKPTNPILTLTLTLIPNLYHYKVFFTFKYSVNRREGGLNIRTPPRL